MTLKKKKRRKDPQGYSRASNSDVIEQYPVPLPVQSNGAPNSQNDFFALPSLAPKFKRLTKFLSLLFSQSSGTVRPFKDSLYKPQGLCTRYKRQDLPVLYKDG